MMTKSTRSGWWRLAGTLSLAGLMCGGQTAFAQKIKNRDIRKGKVIVETPVAPGAEPVPEAPVDATLPPADGAAAPAAAEGKADARVEVLARGPIHVAFLPVVTFSADGGTV